MMPERWEADELLAELDALTARVEARPWWERVAPPIAVWNGPPTAAAVALERRRLINAWESAATDDERARVLAELRALVAFVATRTLGPRNKLLDVKSPGAILDEINTTDRIIAQLDGDIQASQVDAAFKRGWSAFRAEWRQFFVNHQSFADRLFYSVYEKTLEYRKRASEWRQLFEARGGNATAPRDRPPEPASLPSIPWRPILTGGAVLVGGVVLASVITALRSRS